MVQLASDAIATREVLGWKGLHLLHFSGSSCSQKIRIALNLKGLDWTSHPINLIKQENFKPWFLGINPRGLVPVLVHDGQVHIESNDILDYLDEAFPEVKLIPGDLRDAVIGALGEEDDLHLDLRNLTMRFVIPPALAKKKPEALRNFARDKGQIAGKEDPNKARELAYWQDFAARGVVDAAAKASAERFKAAFDAHDEYLSRRPYLLGDRLTMLDVAWFIYSFRLIAAGYPLGRLHPRVFAWYSKLLARDEFSREVKMDRPLKLISGGYQLLQRLKGTRLSDVAAL